MDLPDTVLGTNVASAVRTKNASPILRIGSDVFTRKDLASVECFNFSAAARLSAILNKELNVKNAGEVYRKIHPSALAVPGLGAISLAVLGAAFESLGLGGDAPLLHYVQQHTNGDGVRTFHTIKEHALDERRGEAKARRKRKAQRRDQAHKIRVGRFANRKGAQ